jgi:DNA topoisomerase-1
VPKPLVVVESPAKARTIAGFLGADYEVMASIGHIRDLPKSGLAIDVENGFRPDYEVPAGKKDVVRKLKAALKNADELILATDEDREGEAISWHIVEVLQPKVPIKRMVFHEITPSAIREALANPRQLDLKLVEAQEGRRILDRLVGYEVSPVLWRKIGSQARSAGRVQSVAVRMVVERERARMAFRKGGWFDLEGAFVAAGTGFGANLVELDGVRLATGNDFDANTGAVAEGRDVVLLDERRASALAAALHRQPFAVRSVESQQFAERPKPPFTTSTLQQEAARKLQFPASKTMAVAQRLYERGYITYMRTDSTNLSGQAVTAARSTIREMYGVEYLPDEPRAYRGKVKNAQEAHEAIRPAGERIRTPDAVSSELDADERRLYELVWIRTVACQMVDARARRVTVRLGATATSGEAAIFRASGKTYEFLGFRRAYVEDTDEDDEEREARLPVVNEGDPVECEVLAPAGHETKPPARYTEASLVKELEERGIGRPSTNAAVLGTIQQREYVWKKGTALVPAWSAFAVIRLLEQHFGHLVDYGFTATMEEALDAIAAGEGEAEKWLHSFYFGNGTDGLAELVGDKNLEGIDPRAISTIPIGVDADGEPVVVRVGRYGPYVQRGESDERGSIPADVAPDEVTVSLALELIERQAQGPQALGDDPATGLPVYVLNGRYGPYVQLGNQEQGSKQKPARASLFASMQPDTVTLDDALRLLSLPRTVGQDTEGREIIASPGRFGPYLKRSDGETRSLGAEGELFSITVAEAEFAFSQPKRGRGRGAAKPPIAEFGESPDTGKPMRVLEGRFGPYVTDGITNATVPRGTDPTTLSADEALALLRARADMAPRKRPTKAQKATAKKTTQKAAKATAKKATQKAAKATAKKAAAKKVASKSAAQETKSPATQVPDTKPAADGSEPASNPALPAGQGAATE